MVRGRLEYSSAPAWGRRLLLAMVLGVGFGLTALAWWLTLHWVESDTRTILEKRVENLHGLVGQRISIYDQALNAAAAFIRIAQPTSIHDWAAFVERLRIAENFPGITALAYAAVVQNADAGEFVAAARRDGLGTDFSLWPSAEPEVMVVNRFAAPLNAANQRALGYDMYQDPVRREAMDYARDSGMTAVTRRLTLTIDKGQGGESAFIAYVPVYSIRLPTGTVDERRRALLGFTLSPIRMPTLIARVVGDASPDAVMRIFDGEDPDHDAVLYASPAAETVTRWWRRDIHFSNRTWAAYYGFREPAQRRPELALPWMVALFGGAVTVLLTLVLRNLVNSRGNALRMAEQMTRALRESEAKLKAVFENSVQFQSLLTADCRVVSTNPAALSLVGGAVEQILGKFFWEVGWVDEDQRGRVRDALDRAAGGELVALEIPRLQAGRKMWVDVSFKPVVDEDGMVAWIVAEGRDLTQLRDREQALSLAVDALTRSNQELERFAHVAAHDLQEPCRTIVSYAQLLERRYGPTLGDEGNDFLNYLVGGAHRMRNLVADLLAYSAVKGKAAPFALVDCRQVVTAVVADLQQTIVEAAAVVTVDGLPCVLGDGAQLTQVFLNLIGNALKFRPPGRAPEIRVSAGRTEDGWLFTIADNGIGIAQPYQEQVFEIFQRLHGADRFPGTGIGLAICRKVVERHGGRIWVDSEEGAGCAFRFTLPSGVK